MSQEETNADLEAQYPEPVEGDDMAAAPEPVEDEPEQGALLCRYTESTIHSRGLTLADQASLGVPGNKLVDNSKEATPDGMQGSLEPGMWFTRRNRWTVDLRGAHKILVDYLDKDDASFTVTQY